MSRALAADPDALVCDDVTSALDARTAGAVMDLLEDLRDSRGPAQDGYCLPPSRSRHESGCSVANLPLCRRR